MSETIISVCIITYNHAKFIEQAIESVLKQIVNFKYEIVIADDYSTDGTREILLEYQNKYPKLIKLIFQNENVGPAQNWLDLMSFPTTKYIAYFEGDDFWIDDNKLQLQFDFMEQNSQYTLCFTDYCTVNTEGDTICKSGIPKVLKRNFFIEDVLSFHIPPLRTVLMRRINFCEVFPKYYFDFWGGDVALCSFLASKSELAYIDKITTAWRHHTGGVYSLKPALIKAQYIIEDATILKKIFNEKKQHYLLDSAIANQYIKIYKHNIRTFNFIMAIKSIHQLLAFDFKYFRFTFLKANYHLIIRI